MITLEQSFFGRTEILSLFKKRVSDLKEGCRQNIAIVGNPYVGKSALLEHFVSNFDDEDVTLIYLDLEHKDFDYFVSKFIGSLLYNFSRNKELPLYEDLNLLIETAKPVIPQTIEVVKKIRLDFSQGKINEAFLGLLLLPEIFTNETGKFCVLILDEFQNLEEFSLTDAFQELGKKIMTQKRCLYFVSSSFPSVAQKILSEKLSLLFGNFEIVQLDGFDLKTSYEFIESSFKEIKIGSQLKNLLADFTGGQPLYLNLICQEIVNLTAVHQQSEVYMPIVCQAVENTIFARWGVLSRHFELVMNNLCAGKGNQLMPALLMSLADGKQKISELQEGAVKKTHLLQRLNRLMELGIVVKNGQLYFLKDKLFKYWVKYVYQRRRKNIELAPDRQRKQFKEEFNRTIENFKVTSRKDFPSRIMELLYCFDNESFDLNGRTYKLPLFRELVPVKIKNENGNFFDIIKAFTVDSCWYIVLKDNFAENDVNALLAELKTNGARPERCLIISLAGMDENTRLKALQERFWIWNEQEINTLLTLFDKSFIIR